MPDTTTPATIGHNQPPEPVDLIRAELADLDDSARTKRLAEIVTALSDVALADAPVADLKHRLGEVQAAGVRWRDERPKIETREQFDKGVLFMNQVAAIRKDAGDVKKARKKGFWDAGKKIDAFFNKVTDQCTTLEAIVGPKVRDWERAERERQAAAAAEAERKAEEARKAAEQQQTPEAAAAAAQAQVEAKQIGKEAGGPVRGTYGGTVSSRERQVVEAVTDRAKIPAALVVEYATDDELCRILQRAVAAGATEIPGVRIAARATTTVRN